MSSVFGVKEYLAMLAQFTRPGCDRFAFLTDFLSARGFPFTVIPVDAHRFIHLARIGDESSRRTYSRSIFTAHYDRTPGSPGANDNSAAVVQLLLFLAGSDRKQDPLPLEILFTDHEETALGASPRAQGSFRLGGLLNERGAGKRVFFHFDMCGRGDTVVVSEAGERLLERRGRNKTALYRQLKALRRAFLDRLSPSFRGRILSLPTPFSDNLGFLLQGFPVLQFTLLPAREALAYQKEYQALTEAAARAARRGPESAAAVKRRFAEIQPETWRLRHGPRDSLASLSPEAFDVMQNLFERLAKFRLPELS